MSKIYTICVKNWHEHNPDKKKSHKKTMIANNIVTDAKICSLPVSHRWLFIAILMVCGDYANDTISLTERQVNDFLSTREGATNALTRLQSLQLVTFEIIENSLNKIKVTKEKVTETKITEGSSVPQKSGALEPKGSKKTFSINSFQDFDQAISQSVKDNLSNLYPDMEFLRREFLKMHNWLIANPRKNKKSIRGWNQFISGWLDKGWPQYQKNLPSNRADSYRVSKEEMSEKIRKMFEDKPC